jgi:hypothetical protein
MSDTPQITTHYADGRPSETRDMTTEEIAEMVRLEAESTWKHEVPAPTTPQP